MDKSELQELSDAVSRVLRPHLERSEALRRTLALIGKWLIDEAGQVATEVRDADEPAAPPAAMPASGPLGPELIDGNIAPPAIQPQSPYIASPGVTTGLGVSSGWVPLRLGDALVHLPMTGTTAELGRARQSAMESKETPDSEGSDLAGGVGFDLALTEKRCRLKAASCRHYIKRRAAGTDVELEYSTRQEMNHLLAEAKAMPNCFLWVFWRERLPPDDEVLWEISQNYEAHADAVSLVRRIDESEQSQPGDSAESLRLLAEANSALHAALKCTWLTGGDFDQDEIHGWLRWETASRRVYIERYMSADDPADVANTADLRARVKQVHDRLDDRAGRSKAIKNGLRQIRFHADQIVKKGPDESAADWTRIADGVTKLEAMGVAATDRRIAEAVGPEAGKWLPVEATNIKGLAEIVARARVLAVASESDADDEHPSTGRRWSMAVLEVRDLLKGKRIVIIGGARNGEAVDRLVDAFELSDAEWVTLLEHGPSGPMKAPIFRLDTAVVVVIVKLSGHLHADQARAFAVSAGKPCIILGGGYNPEQIARAVLDQASTRLMMQIQT